MTYAIGYLVHGYNLTGNSFKERVVNGYDAAPLDQRLDSEDAEHLYEILLDDGEYLSVAYSGNGDPPVWLGVRMGAIDECAAVKVSDLPLVTPKHEQELADKAAKLPQWILDIITGNYELSVWIIWGSS